MSYEIIDVDNTSIVIYNNEPMFLNETATFIVKKHVSGESLDEIKRAISDDYDVDDVSGDEIEDSIKVILAQFEGHINHVA